MIGLGFELYQWALGRNLEILLLIFSFILLALLIFTAVNIEWEPCPASLCCNCKYEKMSRGGYMLLCSLYNPRALLNQKKLHCPLEQIMQEKEID